AEGFPYLAVARTGEKYGGDRAAGERIAPVARGQERRSGRFAQPLDVVRDVVARQLGPGGRRHRNGATEIEGERGRVRQDAQHGPGTAVTLQGGGGGARDCGRGPVFAHRGQQIPGQEWNGDDDDGIPPDRHAGAVGQGAERDQGCRAQHDDAEGERGGRNGGLLGGREADRGGEPARQGDE